MKNFIRKHQFLSCAIALTILLAVSNLTIGYPKNWWGVSAPMIGWLIIWALGHGIGWIFAYRYYRKHKAEIHEQAESAAVKECLQDALRRASENVNKRNNNK